MKIARPKPPETEFRRKRSPPPQATKLLLYSLAAGLVFMGLLAIVFVPRYLENLSQPPVVVLELAAKPGGHLEISMSSVSLALSNFNASLLRDNVTIASLSAGLSGGDVSFRFADANGDALLDQGDYFIVSATAQASYRLQVWQQDVGRLVGIYSWEGALS